MTAMTTNNSMRVNPGDLNLGLDVVNLTLSGDYFGLTIRLHTFIELLQQKCRRGDVLLKDYSCWFRSIQIPAFRTARSPAKASSIAPGNTVGFTGFFKIPTTPSAM
jgi:hypothetical protein